jgi:N-acetylglutamate synthase-like GNAT family acetyltransferase
MNDRPQEWRRGSLLVSTDRAKLDHAAVLALLHTTRWAKYMTREQLALAVEESLVFAQYDGGALVGLARVVTDRSTYGYLTDVVIDETRRGKGLGRWLIECILDHRDLQSLRRLTLLTREAPWLYEKFGFAIGSGPSAYMEIVGPLAERRR